MSAEHEPLSGSRDEFNIAHGTNLPEHSDALTLEQAELINETYTIRVVLVGHGLTRQDSRNYLGTGDTTDEEFDDAHTVVEQMQPDDVLFAELYGFNEPTMTVPPDFLTDKVRAQSVTESLREARRITALGYAELLARQKGIEVVFADHDAFQVDSWNASQRVPGQRTVQEVHDAETENDRQRAKAARNIVKDWALEHLPPVGDSVMPGKRKPELVLLFGSEHGQDLEEAFDEKGLDVESIVLPSAIKRSERIAASTATLNELFSRLMGPQPPLK